jgi:hypothetical protein
VFTIPYYMPNWQPGSQIYNPGTGGPQSHMALRSMAPTVYPTTYGVSTYGIAGGGMPRQVIGPSKRLDNNNYSNPLVMANLEVAGLFKNPQGG